MATPDYGGITTCHSLAQLCVFRTEWYMEGRQDSEEMVEVGGAPGLTPHKFFNDGGC